MCRRRSAAAMRRMFEPFRGAKAGRGMNPIGLSYAERVSRGKSRSDENGFGELGARSPATNYGENLAIRDEITSEARRGRNQSPQQGRLQPAVAKRARIT